MCIEALLDYIAVLLDDKGANMNGLLQEILNFFNVLMQFDKFLHGLCAHWIHPSLRKWCLRHALNMQQLWVKIVNFDCFVLGRLRECLDEWLYMLFFSGALRWAQVIHAFWDPTMSLKLFLLYFLASHSSNINLF